MSPRGVSTWSCHLPGPDEGYPAGWGSADYATCTAGTRQEVRGHGPATAWTHTDIQKEGLRGSGVSCGNKTQTRGLTADRPPPRSWRRASGASCAQGLPEGCRAQAVLFVSVRVWGAGSLAVAVLPASASIATRRLPGGCVCVFLVRTPVTWVRVHPAAACPQPNQLRLPDASFQTRPHSGVLGGT